MEQIDTQVLHSRCWHSGMSEQVLDMSRLPLNTLCYTVGTAPAGVQSPSADHTLHSRVSLFEIT